MSHFYEKLHSQSATWVFQATNLRPLQTYSALNPTHDGSNSPR